MYTYRYNTSYVALPSRNIIIIINIIIISINIINVIINIIVVVASRLSLEKWKSCLVRRGETPASLSRDSRMEGEEMGVYGEEGWRGGGWVGVFRSDPERSRPVGRAAREGESFLRDSRRTRGIVVAAIADVPHVKTRTRNHEREGSLTCVSVVFTRRSKRGFEASGGWARGLFGGWRRFDDSVARILSSSFFDLMLPPSFRAYPDPPRANSPSGSLPRSSPAAVQASNRAARQPVSYRRVTSCASNRDRPNGPRARSWSQIRCAWSKRRRMNGQ